MVMVSVRRKEQIKAWFRVRKKGRGQTLVWTVQKGLESTLVRTVYSNGKLG